MQSLYEIETTVLRSSRTQGLSWGVSEEVGKAIRVLEQSNLAGLESFKRIVDLGFDNLNKLLEVNQKNTSNLCPIHFGLFFLDQSHKNNLHQTFHFENLVEPLVSLPFLIKAARKNLIYFRLDSKELVLNISPGSLFSVDKNQIPQVISKFSLTLTTQREIQFSPKTWDDLYKLSLETFVDESEEKRISGAGAGLTDND